MSTTWFRHWSVIGRVRVIDLQYIVRHKRLVVTMLVSTRIARTLSHADDMELAAANVATLVGNVAALATDLFAKDGSGSRRNRTYSCRARTRCSIRDIYKQLGPLYFRRAYRMKFSTFKRLANELRPYILQAAGQRQGDTSRRHVPNGRISPDVRLACAIRWFSGGSPYDMMTTYGISHTETLNSYWYVVDAVNKHPRFTIEYPDDHDAQRVIAQGFHKVSRAGFKCCAGAIDGILIWIHKPSTKDCMDNGCNEGKFYCGRKKKYGLNCQAVCDAKGRILDISILYPGSTSDCLAFESMSLFQKLEEGLLAPGLCIFGDNAYLNTPYMATPYAAVSGGTMDSYNFYHLQLRIRIECAFGMLTKRWAILRSAIPVGVTVAKTVALVLALAKLHNYCIEEDCHVTPDLSYTANDEWNIELNGGVPLVAAATDDGHVIPQQLINGGNHFDDLGGANGRYNRQRRYNYASETTRVPLPRDQLHSYIASIGVTRPTPLSRRR